MSKEYQKRMEELERVGRIEFPWITLLNLTLGLFLLILSYQGKINIIESAKTIYGWGEDWAMSDSHLRSLMSKNEPGTLPTAAPLSKAASSNIAFSSTSISGQAIEGGNLLNQAPYIRLPLAPTPHSEFTMKNPSKNVINIKPGATASCIAIAGGYFCRDTKEKLFIKDLIALGMNPLLAERIAKEEK